MLRRGKIVETDSGRRIRIEDLIKAGGQGEAYSATEVKTGEKGVLKVFFKRFANGDTVRRLRFLVGQELAKACPVLRSPTDVVNRGNMVGHYAPFASGKSLEEFLGIPGTTLIDGVQLAISLAHAVAVLHGRDIAHGDLRAENLIVNRRGSVSELYVIDLDNFNAPGVPTPPMVGDTLYMAPELRKALAPSKPAVPDLLTDRFALGVLMHEIILLRHVAAGSDDNETDFEKAMCSGRWLHDPAVTDKPDDSLGGYPAEVLNAELGRLFRYSLSLDRAERPSPDRWEAALAKAISLVWCCPRCGSSCVVDVSKTVCPLCNVPFPTLELDDLHGVRIPLNRGAVPVGRSLFPKAVKVSARHAVFRRIGPATWMESFGRNGTYRWTGSSWVRLPEGKPVLVQEGDKLRFADLEVTVSSARKA